MPARKSLISTLWLTSSLALLASVLLVPIRTAGFSSVSANPAGSCHAFLASSSQSAGVTASSTGESAAPILAFESEEEERDDEQDSGCFLLDVELRLSPPRSLLRVPYHAIIAFRPTLARFPLRC